MNQGFLHTSTFRAAVVGLFALGLGLFFLFGSNLLPGATVPVVMWTSSEKMNYLPEIIQRFNQERHTAHELFPDGSRAAIEVQALTVNSGTMSELLIEKLRDGLDFPSEAPAPHLASPSVDHWLSRVNQVAGVQVFDLEHTRDLARTPVVIAMYEEMATAMGWPGRELGWSDIIDLATDPKGWARYPNSKLEWGQKPLLAWTDPFVSSTARTALFAAYVAAAGKPAEALTAEDVRNPNVQQYLRRLQGAVDHYFPETLKLQSKLFQGPRFVHFAPLEEYMLPWMRLGKVNAESAPGGKVEAKPLEKRMVAIYPKEGTLWHNNPGGILQNVPWTSREQQQAAEVFVQYLLRPENQQKAMEWGFRPAIDLPYGSYLTPQYGIDPRQPKKLLGRIDPAVAEAIMDSWEDVKKPGVVVLAMDLSGSMAGKKLEQAKEGARRFLQNMPPHNRVGLVTFSDRILDQVPIGTLAENKFRLAEVIDRARATGGTALYDALKTGLEMVDADPSADQAIRGVVLLTDGVRTSGRVRLSDLLELTTRDERPVGTFEGTDKQDKRGLVANRLVLPLRHDAHVFAVAFGDDADLEVLRLLAEATNSTFNRATDKDLADVLERFGKYF
ncbi:MAG: extracellular solute-binding protein [Chloroflexi bacterium]|nr:extracellular solute-binding protein [Chloroflexota bacterium]